MNGASLAARDLGVETVRLIGHQVARSIRASSRPVRWLKANFTGAKAQGLVTKDVELNRIVADAAFREQLQKAPQPCA